MPSILDKLRGIDPINRIVGAYEDIVRGVGAGTRTVRKGTGEAIRGFTGLFQEPPPGMRFEVGEGLTPEGKARAEQAISRYTQPPTVQKPAVERAIEATPRFAKEALFEAPARATASVLLGRQEQPLVPSTPAEKFVFGAEPVKSIPVRQREAGESLKELGLPEGASKTLGFLGVPLLTALDIAPGGGAKRGTGKIARELTEETVLKTRGFLRTAKGARETTKELKRALGEVTPTYEPITNAASISKAEQIIKRSQQRARDIVITAGPPSAEKSALAIRLAKRYEHEGNLDAAVDIIETYDKQLRSAGQFVQAASLWGRMSPEGMVRAATRYADKYGKELAPEVKATILKSMRKVITMVDGPEKDKAMFGVLNNIAEQFPPKAGEIFDAYRYQNMLSNPRSHERNIYSNLFNTFVTRPLDLISEFGYDALRHPFNPAARTIQFSEVPKYYQGAFKAFPEAVTAFKEAFRGGSVSQKILETGAAETTIEAARRAQLPKAVTAIPRFMEAQDKFFGVLIGTGEKTRLMESGVKESKATEMAKELAEKYLFREELGKAAKDMPIFVRALDSLGNLALKGRKLPGIGKAWEWFVPFVRTPINVAKFGVERSPLGFVGGTRSNEQIAKASAGTLVTTVGAVLALQDKTTWAPPLDPKDKQIFYASGRKPYSILIGDTWVPMIYFGPYAVALALPASLKHFQQDTKQTLTENELEKLSEGILNVSRFISSQTPLTGMQNFLSAVEGDVDYSIPKNLGFTAEQIIPLQGLVRYINTIADPIYRKTHGFVESIMKDLPILSKQLEPYKEPTGEPSTRKPINYLLPYDVEKQEPKYETLLQKRIKAGQIRFKARQSGAVDSEETITGRSEEAEETITGK